MPPVPDDATEYFLGWAVKIGGFAITFIGGIITATVTITKKMQGYDLRIASIESNQNKCQSGVLKGIADKLDSLPDTIGDRMEEKFNRVHNRIDRMILKEKSHDDESIKRDKQAMKGIEDVRDNQ